MMKSKVLVVLSIACLGSLLIALCESGIRCGFPRAAALDGHDTVLGFADYTGQSDTGFKALILDGGNGFAYQSVAPNRINTWKIQLTSSELVQLRDAFVDNSFFSLPVKMSGKKTTPSETALFFASDDRYYEVKNCCAPNTAFDTIKTRFNNLISEKTKTAQRVPITEMLYAVEDYKLKHVADSPKLRLVRNVTSDFCRSMASRQDLDYNLAKKHFLADRYLQDVDPVLASSTAK